MMTMAKSKDAFALQAFDKERILRQNFFFSKLGWQSDDTDTNIIDLDNAGASAHLGAAKMEARNSNLRRLRTMTEDYAKLLRRHIDRLSKLSSRYAEKFMNTFDSSLKEKYEKTNTFKASYDSAVKSVDKLVDTMLSLEKENEKNIQKKYREEFAANLKDTRIKRKMTQKELAARLDIAVPSLSQYENAIIEPTLKNLVRLANILDTTTDALLGRAV